MTTPTLKEQEAMARWVGFKKIEPTEWDQNRGCILRWIAPDGRKLSLRPDFTELSTMFRYMIIPKQINYRLESFRDEHLATVWIDEFLSEDSAFVGDKSPGLALFWAIYKLMEGEDETNPDLGK